jgi:eukaryotic-like serine/threonine-protein kinase
MRYYSARGVLYANISASDEELQEEVQFLLASDEAGSLIEYPVLGTAAMGAAALARNLLLPIAMSEATLILKDRYEVERELGRGGMSVVYLARDRQLLAKRVVIKVLLQETSQDPWMRQKFLQEMEALARIDHPGVVGVLDTGLTAEGKQFLVMQYIEGATLRSAIEPGGMGFRRAAGLIRQVGQALEAAHEKGVWHRDLKPENIMLQRLGGEEHVKLIDFGIAGIQNSQFSGEKTKVAGSVAYMAPEQFAGHPCAASDTYALGVVAYEVLTGNRPFSPDSMMHLVTEDKTRPAPPRELRPVLPEAAERAILKAMSFRLELRQAESREFSEELFHGLTGAEPSRTPAVPGTVEMAHLLFTDLVGYSLLPMDQQKEYLGELQQIVRESPQFRTAEAAGDIISLPTGDGLALAFFGDPTAPAQCALEVARGLKSKPHLKLRMGIHSGPVYRVADLNANANLAGGGINMAQRVMDCGDAGHILVSKSVADVLLQLSQWSSCLTDFGECTVKHGVTVQIWSLVTVEVGNPKRPSKLVAAARKAKSKTPLAAALTLLMVVAAATAGYRYLHRPPVLTERDSIVLADFANTTRDPAFDGTLRRALLLKLQESPFLDLLSGEKVRGTLRKMGRTEDERLTPEIGREVCERNGLKAVVSGSIAQLGNNYILQLDATNCATGESVAHTGAEANGKDAVLPSLGKAAIELRRKLGESLSSVQKFDKPFDGTTSSLEALKSYSMALKADREGRLTDELDLYQRTVEKDPTFAAVYASLSTQYSNMYQAEKAAEYGRKAYELRDRVTERGRFQILHVYYGIVLGDLDKLIQSDKLWTLAYPRDFQAFSYLGSAYGKAGQNEKGLEATRQAIRLNPDEAYSYYNSMLFYAALGRFDEAKRVYDEAKKQNISYWHIPVFYYNIAFLRQDMAGMAQAVQEALGRPVGEDEILVEQGLVEAYFGRLQKASHLFQRRLEAAARKDDKVAMATVYATRAHVEALLGAYMAARQDANHALSLASERDVLSLAGWSLARAGDAAHAHSAAQELEHRYPSNTIVKRVYLPALRAHLENARPQPNQAIAALEMAAPYDLGSFGRTISMYAVYVRGEAYLRARQGFAAAAEFQKILDHRGIVMNSPVGALARLGRARAYGVAGDAAKSRAEYQDFFTLWKDADSDLPILVEARKQFKALP